LDEQPCHNRIDDGNFVNVAPPQVSEEVLCVHSARLDEALVTAALYLDARDLKSACNAPNSRKRRPQPNQPLQPTAPLRHAFDDCLARFEESTLALRTGRSDFRRNRTCEMLHLAAGGAFPAEGPLIARISEKT
jgi:hypothetical protein